MTKWYAKSSVVVKYVLGFFFAISVLAVALFIGISVSLLTQVLLGMFPLIFKNLVTVGFLLVVGVIFVLCGAAIGKDMLDNYLGVYYD